MIWTKLYCPKKCNSKTLPFFYQSTHCEMHIRLGRQNSERLQSIGNLQILSNWSLCVTIRTGIFHHYQSTRQEGTWPKELPAICTMETRTIGGQICFAFLINLENGWRQAVLTKTRCLWGTENVTVLETNMETWAECESQDHNGCRQLKLFYTNVRRATPIFTCFQFNSRHVLLTFKNPRLGSGEISWQRE